MKAESSLFPVVLIFILFASCVEFPDIGKPYKLDYIGRSNRVAILDTNNTYVIHGPVLRYTFNDRFIVASERPFDSIPVCNAPNSTLRSCDAAFERSTVEQYWIIDKLRNNVLGPFTKPEMRVNFRKLNVPEDLWLY